MITLNKNIAFSKSKRFFLENRCTTYSDLGGEPSFQTKTEHCKKKSRAQRWTTETNLTSLFSRKVFIWLLCRLPRLAVEKKDLMQTGFFRFFFAGLVWLENISKTTSFNLKFEIKLKHFFSNSAIAVG